VRRSRYLLYWSAVKKTSLRSCDSGSGQISDTSSTVTRRSSRRKSFLSSVVTDGFTKRRSMKTAFAERAGTWWRGGTSTGGRWEPPSRPADPRRALAYEKDDVDIAIFAKIGENQRRERRSSLLSGKVGQGKAWCEGKYTRTLSTVTVTVQVYTKGGGARPKTACPKPYGLPTWQGMSQDKAQTMEKTARP
jgi:hypothetical protein